MNTLRPLALALLVLLPSALTAQQTEDPEPADWTTHHSIQLGGQTVEYDATVGSVILRDEKEAATAELFYTAYLRTNAPDRARRIGAASRASSGFSERAPAGATSRPSFPVRRPAGVG